MTSAKTILALLVIAPALTGCDWIDLIQNKPTKAQRDAEAAAARPAPVIFDVARALETLPDAAPTPEVPAPAQPPVVVAAPEPAPPAEPPFECVTVWRQQTCEAGVLYMLDGSGNWILPGRLS